MDAAERNARHAKSKAMSRLLLDPEAYRAAVAEQESTAVAVHHREDGYSCDWAATMPKREPPPLPPRTLTDAEIARMIADAVAGLPSAPTSAETEALVERVLGKHLVLTPKAIAPILNELRQQLRAEIAKAHISEEFFYLDDDGAKQDAELHGPILRAADYPIDEKIMGPIRARNRAKWLAEREAKRAARIMDLPPLPLRGRRA